MEKRENEVVRNLFDFVKRLQSGIGMYVPEGDFSGVSSIVLGFDLASGGRVLPAFQKWLVTEYEVPENLSWMSGVLYLTGLRTQAGIGLTQEEQARAIAKMFGLLAEYFECRHGGK